MSEVGLFGSGFKVGEGRRGIVGPCVKAKNGVSAQKVRRREPQGGLVDWRLKGGVGRVA